MDKTILIIEDDDAILEVLRAILSGEGYTIITPKTESEIYQFIIEYSPKLILLDIRLTGLDGGEIAKSLKNDKKTKYIPLILMSANAETVSLSQKVKADSFLQKPFTIDELLTLTNKYVG